MKRTLKPTTKLPLVTLLVSAFSALFIAGTASSVQAYEADRDMQPHRHTIRREAARPPVPREEVRPPMPREEVRREDIRREESIKPHRPTARRIRE
ncbi:MAG: hypothetical protein AAGJ95_14535 [Cyanobacteria bacterium J06554_11]